jgi:hypothetical protein
MRARIIKRNVPAPPPTHSRTRMHAYAGSTPLHAAALSQCLPAVQVLVVFGSSLTALDVNNQTPEDVAADIVDDVRCRFRTEFCTRGCHACDQWHSFRESTALTVATINYVQTLKDDLELADWLGSVTGWSPLREWTLLPTLYLFPCFPCFLFPLTCLVVG